MGVGGHLGYARCRVPRSAVSTSDTPNKQLAILRLAAPDAGTKGLADAKAHTDGDPDDEDNDQDPDHDAVALAQACQAGARVPALLSRLGLALPVVLAGPDLAIAPSLGALGRSPGGVVCHDGHRLDICVEGVGASGGRCRDIGAPCELLVQRGEWL